MQLNRLRVSVIFAFGLALAACVAPQPQPPVTPPTSSDLPAQAAEAAARGELDEAAQLYQQAAATAAGPAKADLLLRAARLRLQLKQTNQAADLLAKITPTDLGADARYERDLLQAELLLSLQQPEAARDRLAGLGLPPTPLRPDWLRVQAEVRAANNQALAAAAARAELDGLLTDPAARAANRDQLWALLAAVPLDELRARMPPPPDAFGGWLELAFLNRTLALDARGLGQAVTQWQGRYPTHPANEAIAPRLLEQARQAQQPLKKVAVMLPLSGPYAEPAQALLDGFMAAYYAAVGDKPTVRVFDTGSGPGQAIVAYQDAVRDGAEFVVGPLTKEALVALTALPQLPAPVLALNTLPPEQIAPANLYQFGLSPEDEAVAAADYALARGFLRALVLVPGDDWGTRLAQAFSERFVAGGGEVLEQAGYDATAADYSEPIQALLNLDASEARYRELRGTVRRDLKFEPYRRHDVDVIFVGAYPREARLIQPQLRFFQAMDLPVIATSHAYAGTPDPTTDHDLDGVHFVDMPWLLKPASGMPLERDEQQALHPSAQRYPRLYAFGMDAYRLLPYLQAMWQHVGQSLDGATGTLSLDAQGRVHRRLLPAKFVRGVPVLLDGGSRSVGTVGGDAAPR